MHKYVKDQLKNKAALKAKIDDDNKAMSHMMEVESKSPSLSFDEEGDDVPELVDADGKVPPPVPKDILKEEEKPKPPPTSVSPSVKPQSKPINKNRTRDFIEKVFRRHYANFEKVAKRRKTLRKNDKQFDQLKEE